MVWKRCRDFYVSNVFKLKVLFEPTQKAALNIANFALIFINNFLFSLLAEKIAILCSDIFLHWAHLPHKHTESEILVEGYFLARFSINIDQSEAYHVM